MRHNVRINERGCYGSTWADGNGVEMVVECDECDSMAVLRQQDFEMIIRMEELDPERTKRINMRGK